MEHDDREYRDMLNEGLRDVGPSDELHAKVRGGIARGVTRTRHRNTVLGTLALAIVTTMVLSSVTPVFGRNGTLPQVITAMAAERQAQKITRTLGTATVEQTSAALLVPEATVQTVANSALSETDSILALVIADRAGKPVGDVVALRNQGLGWGVIMTQLGISGYDISEAVGQAQSVASASMPPTTSQGNNSSDKPAVSNKNGSKVVVNGEIAVVPSVSPTSITVAGKTFAIVVDTQMKYHGKPITAVEIFTKRAAGMLYATVQGTELADKTLRANLVIVQDSQDTAEQQQTQQQIQAGQPASNDRQIRGKVTVVTPALLHIDGFASDIVLNADTKVEQVGAGKADLTFIKVGQTVQVHVIASGTTVTAQQVHIEDKYVKTDTSAATVPVNPSAGDQSQGESKTSNDRQIRGKVTVVTPALLHIDGFASDIILNADTKVEQVGAGKADLTFIKVGQTVQVHVIASGTTVTAQQVHIEDKYVKTDSDESDQVNPSVTTWQGTIANVIVQPGVNVASEQALGVVVLSESGQPSIFWVLSTSVVQDANHQTLTLAALQTLQTTAVQKVSIQGTLLSDGTVDVVKLVLTTTSTSSSEPTNPGKGNGKH